MTDLMTIELKGLHFFAFHGIYAEERKTGNKFEVNLVVSYLPAAGIITDISDTVNYVRLYDLMKAEMQEPRELLETFVMEVTELIHLSFPHIKKIEIAITKLHPPIPVFTGTVGVKYSRDF
ncbi:MAG: dihydroneopterin aldolase [Bacteroidota bacterium]|nr:dihydroneopterin aldolase [Bacteroidota bacterium]